MKRNDLNRFTDLHDIQMQIINELSRTGPAMFGALRPHDVATDHFTYHIKTVIEKGLVAVDRRNGKKYYVLTELGKLFADSFEFSKKKLLNQGMIITVFCVSKEVKGETKYLMSKRLYAPWKGHLGFPAGKVHFGETTFETARRELLEETGLEAQLELRQVIHYIDFDETGQLLRDIYKFVYEGKNPRGEFHRVADNGRTENYWLTRSEIERHKVYPGFWDDFFMWGNDDFYIEKVRTVEGY